MCSKLSLAVVVLQILIFNKLKIAIGTSCARFEHGELHRKVFWEALSLVEKILPCTGGQDRKGICVPEVFKSGATGSIQSSQSDNVQCTLFINWPLGGVATAS